jgi:hypothetical protein
MIPRKLLSLGTIVLAFLILTPLALARGLEPATEEIFQPVEENISLLQTTPEATDTVEATVEATPAVTTTPEVDTTATPVLTTTPALTSTPDVETTVEVTDTTISLTPTVTTTTDAIQNNDGTQPTATPSPSALPETGGELAPSPWPTILVMAGAVLVLSGLGWTLSRRMR